MFFIIIFNYYPIRETSEFQKPNCRIFVQIHPRSLSFCLPIRLKSYGISHNFSPLPMGYPVNQSPPSYGISRNENPSVFMGYPINFVLIVFQIPITNKKQLRSEINLKPEPCLFITEMCFFVFDKTLKDRLYFFCYFIKAIICSIPTIQSHHAI